MNTTRSSVLPLTTIALCFTPRQWFDMLGFGPTLDILEAVRMQKNRDILNGRTQYQEPTWFEPTPIRHDNMGSPIYSWQEPTL